ncbi:zip-like iron-zinc transporter [Rhodotorula toruloides]|uniref:Zip-like iron-zinc transporter n=1 Tax=Rhodotorula toruloides TaxID=5286 RepID=A0A511KPP3_RHOTO|nr:zip-like iron-zinc transporter [Rhodotorula toruloides]
MSILEARQVVDATAGGACGPTSIGRIGLRIGAIFVILATSMVGTLFPIFSKRVSVLRRAVPGWIFEFAKFFGSGVILATGLIHLLEPAASALGEGSTRSNGGCINDAWGAYPYAFAICLISLFLTFVTQICAFRLGTARLAKLGVKASPHIHVVGHPGHVQEQDRAATLPGAAAESTGEADSLEKGEYTKDVEVESQQSQHFHDASEQNPFVAQLLGVATLEFGVVLHSVIIGLTLATTEDSGFTTLFVVIIFHQVFEGLGLGTRLSFLKLDPAWAWVPWVGALLYSLCTPIGMAIGLGVREGLSMSGATAQVSSGVLDAFSSGILLYTATVELLAHEFIFNKFYHTCSWKRLFFSLVCFAAGAGVMALLGKWA